MFKKTILTAKSGKKYTLGTFLKAHDGVKHYIATAEGGEELLCISLDIAASTLKRAQLEEFVATPNMMESASNPNLLKIHEKILTEKEMHLLVTKVDMNLEEFLLKNKLDQSEPYFKLLANIFITVYELMHKLKFKKNNISLQNIFLKDSDLLVGGCNLGVIGQKLFPSGLGHLYYRPPEFLIGDETGTEKSDIWAMGLCLYSIYFGQIPFKAVERDDLLIEITSWSKLKNNLLNQTNPIFKILSRMLEADVSKRCSFPEFKEEYFVYNPSAKALIAKKRAKKKLQNFNADGEKQGSIIDGITDVNLRNKIETNLSTSLEFRDNESFPLPNSEGNFSKLSMSTSDVSSSYILTSEDEIEDELLRYLFEKNKIIFIMDGFKQVEVCIGLAANQAIKSQLLYLGLLLVKRAYVENYYIFRLMEVNFNIFNIKSYQRVVESNAYSDIKQFFRDFMTYVKETFHQALPRYVGTDPVKKKQIDNFEKLSLNELNAEIGKVLAKIADHFGAIREKLPPKECKEMAKSCLFWFLLKQNFHTFEKFPKTDDWIGFCQEIEENTSTELEAILHKNGLLI